MARSVAEFTAMMLAMLPKGAAWPRDPDSATGRRFTAMAQEFSLIDERTNQLLKEMLPGSTVELMPEWEQDYNLPGDCITTVQTSTQRRNALKNRYKFKGHQKKQMFIDAAAALGYTITITEYDQNNPGPQADYNGIPLSGDDWNFVWQINAALTTVVRKVVGSLVGEPLSTWGNEQLECVMLDLAHDHRALFFTYV
jgi:uncharacterized protein YmfQ (DUF2313 family)